jgi:hypothetical protein
MQPLEVEDMSNTFNQLTVSCLLIGFDTDGLLPPVWKGGESEALGRLERHLERKAWVASFGCPKMTPQSLLASQTGLSPYLRFGCLSTRLFYYQLTKLYKQVCAAISFRYSSHQFTGKIYHGNKHLMFSYVTYVSNFLKHICVFSLFFSNAMSRTVPITESHAASLYIHHLI